MTTMRAMGPAVAAVLMSSLVLAACGPAPTPAGEAPATSTGDAIDYGAVAAGTRTAAMIAGREVPAPSRNAHAASAGPGGICPSQADEPAPIDGGREVTQAADNATPVRDLPPAED